MLQEESEQGAERRSHLPDLLHERQQKLLIHRAIREIKVTRVRATTGEHCQQQQGEGGDRCECVRPAKRSHCYPLSPHAHERGYPILLANPAPRVPKGWVGPPEAIRMAVIPTMDPCSSRFRNSECFAHPNIDRRLAMKKTHTLQPRPCFAHS